MSRDPGDITRLLVAWRGGDAEALDDLIPLVYNELRSLAAAHLARESGPRTLQPTALVHEDEIGVSPSLAPKFPNISIPYGSLVPESLEGLLACGRHIACDPNSHSFLREIPQCWVTGQAAGTAAAIAARRGCEPRAVDIAELQRALDAQGVFLRHAAVTAPA